MLISPGELVPLPLVMPEALAPAPAPAPAPPKKCPFACALELYFVGDKYVYCYS